MPPLLRRMYAWMKQYPPAIESINLAIIAAGKERRSNAQIDQYRRTLATYESKFKQRNQEK